MAEEAAFKDYVDYILRHIGDESTVTKAILHYVFNRAINLDENAKDLLIITNITDTIPNCDHMTQILYNRTIAQLGLNAFHFGNLHEVQHYLSDLCKDSVREMVGQGSTRFGAEK